MNINKLVACFLAATTCVSCLPNTKAAETKETNIDKTFNKIVNSKGALYALGAFDLVASIGAITLLSPEISRRLKTQPKGSDVVVPGEPKKGSLTGTPHTNTIKQVTILIEDPISKKVNTIPGDQFYYIESVKGIKLQLPNPNQWPDPTKVNCTNLFPILGAKLDENGKIAYGSPAEAPLGKALQSLIRNGGQPDVDCQFLKIDDIAPTYGYPMAKLNVDNYVKALRAVAPPPPLKRDVPSPQGPKKNESSSEQPGAAKPHAGKGQKRRLPTPPPNPRKTKIVTFEFRDPSGKVVGTMPGNHLYCIPGSPVKAMLPEPDWETYLSFGNKTTEPLKKDLEKFIANVDNPSAEYSFLKISDGDPSKPQKGPGDILDVDKYINAMTPPSAKIEDRAHNTSVSLLAAYTELNPSQSVSSDDSFGEDEDENEEPKSIPAGTQFKIVTIPGIKNCTYLAYRLPGNVYYMLPSLTSINKDTPLNHEERFKIFRLATDIGNRDIADLSAIAEQNGAKIYEFSGQGHDDESEDENDVKTQLNGLNIILCPGEKYCHEAQNLQNYSDVAIRGDLFSEIRQKLNNRGCNYYFYQLTENARDIKPLDPQRTTEPNFWKDNVVYILPSKQDVAQELHYLVGSENKIKEFIRSGGLPTEDKYPRDDDNTCLIFEKIIFRNKAENRELEAIPEKLKRVSEIPKIIGLPEYTAWQTSLANEREKAERAKQENEKAEKAKLCTPDVIKEISGYLQEVDMGSWRIEKKETPESMEASHIATRSSNLKNSPYKRKSAVSRFFMPKSDKDTLRMTVDACNLNGGFQRILLNPDITLANDQKVEMRGKYLLPNKRSQDLQELLKPLTMSEYIDVCHVGTFAIQIANHLQSGLGAASPRRLTFAIAPKDTTFDNGHHYQFGRTFTRLSDTSPLLTEEKALTCYVDEDYFLKGQFYDDFQEDKEGFKNQLIEEAKKIRLIGAESQQKDIDLYNKYIS